MEILTIFSNPDSDTDHLVDKIVILINIMLTIIKEEQSKPYSCTFGEGPLTILYPALIFNGPLFGPYKDFNLLNADFQFSAEPPLDGKPSLMLGQLSVISGNGVIGIQHHQTLLSPDKCLHRPVAPDHTVCTCGHQGNDTPHMYN